MKPKIIALTVCLAAFAATAFAVTQIKETGAGYLIGTTANQAVGFHGATPAAQRAGSAQTAVTDTVGAAVATTAATNSSPYGYSQTQADALVSRVNQLRADVIALTALNNELRAALVEKGLIKGGS